MTGRPAAEVVRDGEATIKQMAAALADMQAILDGARSRAIPFGFLLLARAAFADAVAYREGDQEDAPLRELYEQALDALGGPPDGSLWAVISNSTMPLAG